MFNPEYFPKGISNLIGFSFDLGSISSPKYGNATNLSGEVLFPLAPGTYKVPSIVDHPEIFEKQVIELLPLCRDVFPDHLDEDIVTLIKDFAIVMYLGFPTYLSPEMAKLLTLMAVTGFGIDDIVDNGSDGASLIKYKTLKESLKEYNSNILSKGANAAWDFLPSGIHATLDAIRKLGIYSNAIGDRIVPNYAKLWAVGPFIESLINAMQAVTAINELKAQGQHEYSQTTLFDLNRKMSGNCMTMFSTVKFCNAELSPTILSDILFKCSLNNFSDILLYYNAIFGLPRDIKKEQEDSQIIYFVLKKKMTLQEAFNCVYELLLDAYSDYMINTTKLAEVYADEPNLLQAIECMHYQIVTTLIGYKISTRYGIQDTLTAMYKD